MKTAIETEGGDPYGRLGSMLEAAGIDPSDIERIEVVIHHNDGGDEGPTQDDGGSVTVTAEKPESGEPDGPAVDAGDAAAGVAEAGEASVEAEEVERVEGIRIDNIPDMQTNSDAFIVLEALVENDTQHWHVQQIREFFKDGEVNKNSISRRLTYLSDNGLVDKQPSEKDRRMNKWRATSKGHAAVEVARR